MGIMKYSIFALTRRSASLYSSIRSQSTFTSLSTPPPPPPRPRSSYKNVRNVLSHTIIRPSPVPGSDARKLQSSRKLQPDTLILDLEDSVPLSRKKDARDAIAAELFARQVTLPHPSECAIRINSAESDEDTLDLAALIPDYHAFIDAIVIPKVHSAAEILRVVELVEQFKTPSPAQGSKQIALIACIESARGVMNLREIATCHSDVQALVFAAEDYCADVLCERTSSRLELLYARQAVVTAAKAYGLQAIDMVCVDFKRPDILETESHEGREFGFTGKQAIHPAQIEAIHSLFLPNAELMAKATAIIDGYVDHVQRDGKGAFALNGQVVDMPVVKWAQSILNRVPAPSSKSKK